MAEAQAAIAFSVDRQPFGKAWKPAALPQPSDLAVAPTKGSVLARLLFPLLLANQDVDRNEQAWTVAKHLGQLNRASMDNCQHLGDVGFRRDLLLFFLEKGCQPPPQMLHILKGLPKATFD